MRLALALACLAPTPALAEPLLELRVGPLAVVAEAEDISQVTPQFEGDPGFDITVSERFAAKVTELTGSHVGEVARVSICGEVVVRPTIIEPITGQAFRIVPIAPEKVEPYLKWLTGTEPCPGANP